ncbi:MAG TPA: site-specific integrase [Bacteroidales bacterium]|nr:site-specific integrase [Bacteroidales bacterium]
MSKIKPVLFKSKKLTDGKHPVMLRITHHKIGYVAIGCACHPHDWDNEHSCLKSSFPNSKRWNNRIRSDYTKAENYILEMEARERTFTVEDVANHLKKGYEDVSFMDFTQREIDRLKSANKLGNAAIYQMALNLVKKFRNEKDFVFDDLNYKMLNDLEFYCQVNKNTVNTISLYMRTIRAIYNKAIKEGYASLELYPFKTYKIKYKDPPKRALNLKEIKLLKNCRVKKFSSQWHAKNLFFFSFYSMGMNFHDMALLKVGDIRNGRIYYKRAKTGGEFNIKVSEQLKKILSCYLKDKSKNDYVFPIVVRKEDPALMRTDINNGMKWFNDTLKDLADLCEIQTNLTSYVARHSWATIASRKNINIGIISEGLGHKDIKTTQTYLASFGNDELDNANEIIIDI